MIATNARSSARARGIRRNERFEIAHLRRQNRAHLYRLAPNIRATRTVELLRRRRRTA
jgi:hypothetical protein